MYFAKGHPLEPKGLPDLIALCPISKSQQLKYFCVVHPSQMAKVKSPVFKDKFNKDLSVMP